LDVIIAAGPSPLKRKNHGRSFQESNGKMPNFRKMDPEDQNFNRISQWRDDHNGVRATMVKEGGAS